MQRSVPEHAPLLAPNCVCHTCGSIMKPEVIKGRGGVTTIKYSCYNKETGCSYYTETNQYLSSEVFPSRPKVSQV